MMNDFAFFPEWYFCTKAIFCQLPHNFWLRSPSERRWAILMDSFPVQFFHRWQNIDKLFLCEIDMSLMFLKIAISTSFSCFSSSRMEIFWMTFYFSFLSFNNWIHWSWNLIIAKQRDLNKRKLLLEVLLTFKIVLFVTEKLQQTRNANNVLENKFLNWRTQNEPKLHQKLSDRKWQEWQLVKLASRPKAKHI